MSNSTPDDASSGLHDLRTSMSFERNGEKINVQVGHFVEVFAGDSLPYIARVATIGKDDQGEVVAKMQWFYRQSEIPPNVKKRLGRKLEKNEVFLSTHLDFNAVESVLNSVKIQFIDNEGRSFVSRGEGDQMDGPKYVCSCDYNVAEDKASPLSAEKVRWLRKTHNTSESNGNGEAATAQSQKMVSRTNAVTSSGDSANRKVVSRTNSVTSAVDKRDHNIPMKNNKEQVNVDNDKVSKPEKVPKPKSEEPKSKSSQSEPSKDTKNTKPDEKTESNADSTSSPQAKRQRLADAKSVSSQGSGAAVKQKKKQGKVDDQSKKKSRIVVSSSSSGETSDEESTAAEDDDLNSVATVRSSSDVAIEQKSNGTKRETASELRKIVNEKDSMKTKNDEVSLEKPKGAPSKTPFTDKPLSEMEKKKSEAVSTALGGIQKSLSDSSKPVQVKTGETTIKSVKSVIAAEEKRKDADAQTKKIEQPSLLAKVPEPRPLKAEPLERALPTANSEDKGKQGAIEPKGEDGKPQKLKTVTVSNQSTRTEQDTKSLRQAVSEPQSNQGAKLNEKEDKATTNLVKPPSDGGVAPVRPKTPQSDTSLSTDGDEFGLSKNVTPSKSRVDSAKKRMSEAKKSIRAPDPYLRPNTDDEAVYRALSPEPSAIEQNFAGLAMSKEGRKSPTPPPERPSSSRRRGRDRSLDPEDELDNARLHLQPHGAVRIGSQYQATLPAYLGTKPPQPTCNAQLVSKPSSAGSMPVTSIVERCSRRGSILALALSEPSSPVEEEKKRVLWVRVCEPLNSEGNVRVCPFDACWPKVQGKPESFVVPKSTMMMMAPSKSFIQSDAFPVSLSSSPGDTIATWSEQEYIAFCEALKKIRSNSQITTLLATAVKTKTPTEVVEMFWIPRRGIGSAPHVIVTCSKCNATRVPLVSCKSYFMCRSVVCEKCFKDMHGKLIESDRESDVLSLFQRAKYGHWFCKICVKRPASTAEALPSKPESSISVSSVLPSTNKPNSANVETKTGSTMAISTVIGGKQPAGTTGKAEGTASGAPTIKSVVTQGKPVAGSVASNAKKQGSSSDAAQPVKPQAASAAIPATPAVASAQVSVNDDSKTRAPKSTVDAQPPLAQVTAVTDSKPQSQVALAKSVPSVQTTMSLQADGELEEADTIAGVIQLHDAGKVSPEDAIERIRAILVTEAKKNLELAMLLAKSKGK